MASKDPAAQPIRKFFGKYYDSLIQGEKEERGKPKPKPRWNLLHYPPVLQAESFSVSWEEVQQWWPVRLLRQAASEKDAEAYKRILHFFLLQLSVRPPKGVLLPFRWGAGRPEETEFIYEHWVEKGRPPLTGRMLDSMAKAIFPDQYRKALSDSKQRKNLRDRVGNAIRRRQENERATKSP